MQDLYLINELEKFISQNNIPWIKRSLDLFKMGWYEYLINEIFNSNVTNKRVLDIGCGWGPLEIVLEKQTPLSMTAGDINSSLIELAQKIFLSKNLVKFLVFDMEKLPFDDNQFDIVFSLGVLQHARSPQKAISEISRVLINHGIVYIFCYGPAYPLYRFLKSKNLKFILIYLISLISSVKFINKPLRIFTQKKIISLLIDKNLLPQKIVVLNYHRCPYLFFIIAKKIEEAKQKERHRDFLLVEKIDLLTVKKFFEYDKW